MKLFMSNIVPSSVESGHVFPQKEGFVLEVSCPYQRRGFPVCGLLRMYSWRGQLWSDEATNEATTAATSADGLGKCHAHYNINALYSAFGHIDTHMHTPSDT